MQFTLRLLFICALYLAGPLLAAAQTVAEADSTATSCKFSCPETDTASAPLVKRPNVIGYDSFYSIFECMYHTAKSSTPEHKCSYYKTSGLQALAYAGDNCPAEAVPCPTGESDISPMFSNQDKDEVSPWVESGRYLLYLKEHPPS